MNCGCRDVREIPIYFTERQRGQSKVTLREQGRYLRHVARLTTFRMTRR